MKILSAIIFASAGYTGGIVAEIRHMHRDHGYSPELGMTGAVIGLGLFATLFVAVIYAYGAASQAFRREAPLAAPILSAVVGLPFWVVILPMHTFLRDRLGLPDNLWWIETVLICAASFEIIRLSHGLKTKMA